MHWPFLRQEWIPLPLDRSVPRFMGGTANLIPLDSADLNARAQHCGRNLNAAAVLQPQRGWEEVWKRLSRSRVLHRRLLPAVSHTTKSNDFDETIVLRELLRPFCKKHFSQFLARHGQTLTSGGPLPQAPAQHFRRRLPFLATFGLDKLS